ncbi:speckle targeted PIP5K1A-regulated poly(A) polymerase-like [Diachasma alloeum]|uniref:speckle targeted PIP5K1A-regulated poly(A) polymerase-like n=1 Tax=Diachasma alloeum TaxID=454923 RepID=UPI00073814BF|nr:speckle targeted PIP5K1A-regulated poly(A) polymerase-like [Diachasma alloeum]
MSKRCEICAIDFIDEYSFHGHLLGKKHTKKLELMKLNLQREQNSVFVSPMPPFATPQLVVTFFSKFGPIQHYTFNPRYLIVEYKDKSPVEYLLSNPIYLNQWKLKIRRRRIENPGDRRPEKRSPKKQNSIPETNQEIEEAEALRTTLGSEEALEDQLTKFLSTVQRDDGEVQKLGAMVCSSLDRTMKQSFPRCRAIPFGSSVTGLSLVGSDLDVFLDIGEQIVEDEESPPVQRLGWTPKTIFKEVKTLLFRNAGTFTKIVPIPMAKIPVIKFHHTLSKMDCDISFKHGLGVHNSQLIKYLLTLDSRIKPLVLVLKYWAKKLDISGSGKINNYSLVMLIVFYLQQPSVNLLPAIRELQKVHERVYIRGWQVNFTTNYPSTSKNNSSSILELLEGFFKFYSDFDFSTTIICPLEGKSFLREEFKREIEERGGSVESLRLTRCACLQDPIQLDHNIISGWGSKELQGLRFSCLQAVEICQSLGESPLRILPKLFDPALKVKTKKAKPVSFVIPAGKFERFGLPEDFEEMSDVGDKQMFIEKNWFCTVYRLLEAILKRIFMFEVQIVYDKVGVKQMKVVEEDDVHSKDRDHDEGSRIMLSCSGKYFLNRARKGKRQTLDPSVSPIEKEALISEQIMKDVVGKVKEVPIKFECLLVKKSKPLEALVVLTDQQFNNKSFGEIAGFMRGKVCTWVEKELMHMVQFKKTFAQDRGEKS